jgi:hypothetical protein
MTVEVSLSKYYQNISLKPLPKQLNSRYNQVGRLEKTTIII